MNIPSLSPFDWISIAYSFLSLDTLRRLVKHWTSVWDEQVTELDRFLIQRTALFLLIPIGVLFHELGHVIATWQVGGTVVEFQWRIFWGYIIPSGYFTAVEYWWIALSGNVVSIALGLIALPAVVAIKKQVIKELLYSFAVVQLVYSLVFYPVFSFTGFEGDWVKIYDFSVRPYAQITLVIHVGILVGLWYVTSRRLLDPTKLRVQSDARAGEMIVDSSKDAIAHVSTADISSADEDKDKHEECHDR
ncbi:MAG: hypothetical protein AAF327_02705 [Cyanobacteria bacterium P01_A01_bin.37]